MLGKIASPVKSHAADECRRKLRRSGIFLSISLGFKEEEAYFYSIKFHFWKKDKSKHIAMQDIQKNNAVSIKSKVFSSS